LTGVTLTLAILILRKRTNRTMPGQFLPPKVRPKRKVLVLRLPSSLVLSGTSYPKKFANIFGTTGSLHVVPDLRHHVEDPQTVVHHLIDVTRTTMALQVAHQLNDVPMSTILLAAIKRLTAMSSLMLFTPIRMHQHWLQCQEKILFWLPYKNRRPSVSFWPIRTGLLQLLHHLRLTTAPLSLTVNATSKLIPTVFSTDSAKQLVKATAKQSPLSLIEVLTVAEPEKMSASLSILSVKQTSVVSTTIPWLAYPL